MPSEMGLSDPSHGSLEVPTSMSRWRMLLGFLALSTLPGILVAALLLPDYRLVILTLGMVFILVVATYAARKRRAGMLTIPSRYTEAKRFDSDAALSGPLRHLERIVRRRARVVGGGLTLGVIALVVAGTILQPPRWDQLISFALNIGFVFVLVAAFAWMLDYLGRRWVRQLAPLGPYVNEASLPLRGPTLLMKNGLLMSFYLGAAFVTIFFTVDGALRFTRLNQAVRWTEPGRMRRVATVRDVSGPPDVRSELAALQAGIGAFFSVAVVQEPQVPNSGELGPRWIVSATFVGSRPRIVVAWLEAEQDRIVSFLQRVLRSYTQRLPNRERVI